MKHDGKAGKHVCHRSGLACFSQAKISGGSNEVEKLFYSHDALGSVIALSDNKGKLATRYHYDAFGELLEDDISKNEYLHRAAFRPRIRPLSFPFP